MFKKLFYFIVVIFIHCPCFSIEKQINSNQQIQSVPLRLTIFSPFTDLDFFSSSDASVQMNYFLFGIVYAKSDYLYGLGISGFILNTSDDMFGIQFSLINQIGGNGRGTQFGIINYSHKFYGFQLGALNRTDNVAGLQLGILNTADDVEGIQIGIVNIAKDVMGSQLGIINIANDQDGFSFGFLSFLLKIGQAKLSVWYDTQVPFNISVKTGRKYFYGILELNIPNFGQNMQRAVIPAIFYPAFSQFPLVGGLYKPYVGIGSYISLGVGTQMIFEPVWVGLEAKWRDLTENNGRIVNSLELQYSILVGTTVDKKFDYFGSVSLNSPGIHGAEDIMKHEKYIPDNTYSVSFGLGCQFLFSGIPNW